MQTGSEEWLADFQYTWWCNRNGRTKVEPISTYQEKDLGHLYVTTFYYLSFIVLTVPQVRKRFLLTARHPTWAYHTMCDFYRDVLTHPHAVNIESWVMLSYEAILLSKCAYAWETISGVICKEWACAEIVYLPRRCLHRTIALPNKIQSISSCRKVR